MPVEINFLHTNKATDTTEQTALRRVVEEQLNTLSFFKDDKWTLEVTSINELENIYYCHGVTVSEELGERFPQFIKLTARKRGDSEKRKVYFQTGAGRGFQVVSAYEGKEIQLPKRATTYAAGYDIASAEK